MSANAMIETDRLTLHEITLGDVELMLAVWNDPAFVHFVGVDSGN